MVLITAYCFPTSPLHHPLLCPSSPPLVDKAISKSVWTCCVESVMRYVRVTFDLFPDERQVCVAAVDYAKCQPINSWRDEDQELGKVGSEGRGVREGE